MRELEFRTSGLSRCGIDALREWKVMIELVLPTLRSEVFDSRNTYTAVRRIRRKCKSAEAVFRMNGMMRGIPPVGSSVSGTSHTQMIRIYNGLCGLLARISLRAPELLHPVSVSWMR
jgi:hypothetical protein